MQKREEVSGRKSDREDDDEDQWEFNNLNKDVVFN